MEKALSDMLTNDGFWITMVTTSEKTDVISVYGPKVSTATPKVVTIGKDEKIAFLSLHFCGIGRRFLFPWAWVSLTDLLF